MKYLFACLIIVLLVLHQDYWQWHDATLDFGFVPRGLTYHAVLSVLAAVFWAAAVHWCWPLDVDDAPTGDGEEAA